MRRGPGPGNASRLALDEILEVRDFLNEGGQVLYTGKWAGSQFTAGFVGKPVVRPDRGERAVPADPARAIPTARAPAAGSGDFTDDA